MNNEMAENYPLDRKKLKILIRFAIELRQALGNKPGSDGRMGNAQALLATAKAVFQELGRKLINRLEVLRLA